MTKFCGGLWKLSVYSTGIVGSNTLLFYTPNTTIRFFIYIFNCLSSILLSTDYPLSYMVGCYNLDTFRHYDKKVYTLKESFDSHRCFYICNERGYVYAAVNEYIPYLLFHTNFYAIYYLQLVTYVNIIDIEIIVSAAMKHRMKTIRKNKTTVENVLMVYRNIAVVPAP